MNLRCVQESAKASRVGCHLFLTGQEFGKRSCSSPQLFPTLSDQLGHETVLVFGGSEAEQFIDHAADARNELAFGSLVEGQRHEDQGKEVRHRLARAPLM